MNNFGVIELATTKHTAAPGWAYVPDVAGPHLSSAYQSQPSNRKRARHQGATLSYADLDARQEAKLRRELEALDRDNHRDVHIPIPPKPKGAGSRGQGKHTPNVRKILQSQKTFANHLDDFVAWSEGGGANTSTAAAAATARSAAERASAALRHKRGDTPLSRTGSHGRSHSKHGSVKTEDTPMPDAPAGRSSSEQQKDQQSQSHTFLPPSNKPPIPPHPQDDDPLLVSRVPPMPSDEELRALMSAPPLTYLEARAGWTEEDQKYPVRVFCEICGYWGRVRCMKCGTRVCALDCLETHREECVTRYGL